MMIERENQEDVDELAKSVKRDGGKKLKRNWDYESGGRHRRSFY